MPKLPQCNTEWCLITFYQFPTERQMAGVTKFESLYSLYRPVWVERSEKSDTLYEIYFSALFLTGDSKWHSEDIIWSSAFTSTVSRLFYCLCTCSIKHNKVSWWLMTYYIGEGRGRDTEMTLSNTGKNDAKKIIMENSPALHVACWLNTDDLFQNQKKDLYNLSKLISLSWRNSLQVWYSLKIS